eukprot:366522-Chlamydomonas_euryale.AAC.3
MHGMATDENGGPGGAKKKVRHGPEAVLPPHHRKGGAGRTATVPAARMLSKRRADKTAPRHASRDRGKSVGCKGARPTCHLARPADGVAARRKPGRGLTASAWPCALATLPRLP